MESNSIRGFSSLVGLTAFRSKYDLETKTSKLFVGVQFDQQAIGTDDEESPITFLLRVRRVELKVLSDLNKDTEILKNDRKLAGVPTHQIGAHHEAGLRRERKHSGSLSATGPQSHIEDNDVFSKSAGKSSKQQQIGYHVATKEDHEGHPVYVFEAAGGGNMQGAGWNGEPHVATLKYLANVNSKIKGEPLIEVETSAQYLDIDSIYIKDAKVRKKYKSASKQQRLVALAYLKKCVVSAGHRVGNIEDDLNAPCVLLSVTPREIEDV